MRTEIRKSEHEDKERKVTYTGKEAIHCPICEAQFHREELFSGRVNAGELTDELHRRYIPMQAWGEVHPLIYEITVCPSCWFAAFKTDFATVPAKIKTGLEEAIPARVDMVQRLFKPLDFNIPRGLVEGAASYYLAMLCYESFPKDFSPTIKQGICALRAAWLCKDLEQRQPGENWAYAAELFYRKARFLYRHAAELDQTGKEALSSVKWLGPDTDKSYGYESVLYLAGVLELKYGPKADQEKRIAALDASKRAIAKMFGLGRRSRSKPGPLLDKARDLYDQIKAVVQTEDDED